MFTVENDWIQYETVPARRPAVRGGAACAQRVPVRSERVVRPVGTVQGARAQGRAPQEQALRQSVASNRTVSSRVAQPRPVAHRAAPVRRTRLRLTRRGRIVLIVLPGLLALSGALTAVGAPLAAEAAATSVTSHP